ARWCLQGVKLADGRSLRLEYIRVGDRMMTSKAGLLRFLAAQQDNSVTEVATQPRTPTQRMRAAAKAEAELSDLGI
ncbi:MAG: hypothetical protein K8T89_10195, partial [Planctomycetes bacterium]|nr:hypothetical protein [Planctomycetota bacterium]